MTSQDCLFLADGKDQRSVHMHRCHCRAPSTCEPYEIDTCQRSGWQPSLLLPLRDVSRCMAITIMPLHSITSESECVKYASTSLGVPQSDSEVSRRANCFVPG